MFSHSEAMIHQPSTGVEGKESDIRIIADHITRKKEELIDILSDNCSKTRAEVSKDIESDYYMNARECIVYGLADKEVN